VVTMRTEDGHK